MKRVEKLNLDTSHFTTLGRLKQNRRSLEQVLSRRAEGSGREHSRRLREALLATGREYSCASCEISTWMGVDLRLEINHIDGDYLNNEASNLEFLCPNCHSLSPHDSSNRERAVMPDCLDCGKRLSSVSSERCRACANRKLGRERAR